MPDPDGWLVSPELTPVWERIRTRLESNGGDARGRAAVTVSSRQQRHALSDLLGRPVLSDRVTVDLAALERRLVERTAFTSLADAVHGVTGWPLRDRPHERRERVARRQGPLELARSLVDDPWVESWLSGLSRSGVLTRAASGEALVRHAVEVLRAVLSGAHTPGSRVELAARIVGDSHALDEDTLLHAVVLRGLAAAADADVPTGVVERRAMWEQHGISPDLVSATCLALGLRPTGEGPLSSRLGVAAEAGDPVHLTAWDLRRRRDTRLEGDAVLVCENPRVLEAVAERFGGAVPVVCTAGQPNTVVTGTLAWLRESGRALRYHGDFDWPGIAITNRLGAQCGVEPWLMRAADYEAGFRAGSLKLAGTPVEPCWDTELGASMRTRGIAVHEESVLEQVLMSLESGW
jgi:uncharacterized protein (TIGR02679 family)